MERIIETNVSLVPNVGDDLAVKFTQEIPDHFIQDIQDRFTGKNDATGDFLFVGSVPSAVADRWMREGYNVFEEPIAKTLAKLRAENMAKFIGTSKNI
jgi:hypothetical protein